jgi:hypothetical protein
MTITQRIEVDGEVLVLLIYDLERTHDGRPPQADVVCYQKFKASPVQQHPHPHPRQHPQLQTKPSPPQPALMLSSPTAVSPPAHAGFPTNTPITQYARRAPLPCAATSSSATAAAAGFGYGVAPSAPAPYCQ